MPFLRASPELYWQFARLNNLLDPQQCAIHVTPHVKRQFLSALESNKRATVSIVDLQATDVQLIEYMLSGELMRPYHNDLHRAIAYVCTQVRPNSPTAVALSTSQKLRLSETIAAHRDIIARKADKIAELQQLVQQLKYNKSRVSVEQPVAQEHSEPRDIEVFGEAAE